MVGSTATPTRLEYHIFDPLILFFSRHEPIDGFERGGARGVRVQVAEGFEVLGARAPRFQPAALFMLIILAQVLFADLISTEQTGPFEFEAPLAQG